MRPLGVFAVLSAAFWIPLGQLVIRFYEIGGLLMAWPLGMMMAIALSALWREAGTRVNPSRGRLWVAWLVVLPWLLLLAWARFLAPETATGLPGLAMAFFGGLDEGPVLLQKARYVHIGIGAVLLGWSLIELIVARRRSGGTTDSSTYPESSAASCRNDHPIRLRPAAVERGSAATS